MGARDDLLRQRRPEKDIHCEYKRGEVFKDRGLVQITGW
jgi:hypothetical protein